VPHAAKVDTTAEQEQRSVTGGLFDSWIPISCVSCTSWFLRRGQVQDLAQADCGVLTLYAMGPQTISALRMGMA
jgi:hypothetical protein